MIINDNLISNLEDLTFLTLSDSEKSLVADDLRILLDCISRLGELNTEGARESCHPWEASNSESDDYVNIFREDEARPSLDRALALKNAPVKNEEFFVAPKTMD